MGKNKSFIIVIAVLLALGFVSFSLLSKRGTGGHMHSSSQATAKYYCPMHPQVISDKPGDCPICHMRLVSADSKKSHEDSLKEMVEADGEKKILFYRNPMNPKVTSPVPMKDEMGMDYIPVHESDMTGEKSGVPGHASVSISPQKQQLIGMKTSVVEKKELKKEIGTVGRVAYDPDLYQAQAEYIQAAKALEKTSKGPDSPAKQWAQTLAKSSETKLFLMGLNEAALETIAQTGEPDQSLLYAQPNGEFWVYANIFEYEIPLIKVGQEMEVRVPSLPGKPIKGNIQSIDTVVDPMTRSVKVRAKIKNENGSLRPDMFVNVTIHTDVGIVLTVPEEAVLLSGNKSTVFVEKKDGYFEPRNVVIGQKSENSYEIKEGLREGEKVVTNGNFFVDSESRLKAALSGMGEEGASS